MKTKITIAVLAASASLSLAQDFSAEFIGRTGVGSAVTIDGEVQSAGQFGFQYTSAIPDIAGGQFSTTTFFTFCIELQRVESGSVDYTIGDISDAPNPVSSNGGAPYGAADEQEVNAVVAAAMRLNWINADLSISGANNSQLAAIQGLIWKVLFDGSTVEGIGNVATWMDVLAAEAATDPTARVANLATMTSATSQDQLYIVPLPPAALAGLLTLGGLAGVARIRRNRA